METVKVRSFLDGDEKTVANIHNVAFKDWIELLGKEYDYHHVTPGEVLSWMGDDQVKHESLWIAELEGEAAGYAHCHFEEMRGKKGFKELLFVQTSRDMGQSKIAVVPEYRRRGVAKALIQRSIEHFEPLGASLATVITYSDNRVAEELLRQLGFVHREFFYYGPYSNEKPWRYDSVYAELDLNSPVKVPYRLNRVVNVRLACGEDAVDVAEVFRKSAPWSPFGPDASADQILKHYLKSASFEVIFVAEYGGKVVGVMDFNSGNSRLGIPGVLPEHQNKGVGYTLFHQLLESMRQRGFSKAIVDTGLILSDAIRMYGQFGFKIVRRQCPWIKVLQ